MDKLTRIVVFGSSDVGFETIRDYLLNSVSNRIISNLFVKYYGDAESVTKAYPSNKMVLGTLISELKKTGGLHLIRADVEKPGAIELITEEAQKCGMQIVAY